MSTFSCSQVKSIHHLSMSNHSVLINFAVSLGVGNKKLIVHPEIILLGKAVQFGFEFLYR